MAPPTRVDDAPSADVRGVSRYEWEQIIRRARLDGLIDAKPGRGAVSAALFTAVAMVLASYADGDTGHNVRPGDATVAVEAKTSLATVKAVKAKLLELDMLRRTRAGARRQRDPDVYQLTLPADILDRLDVLTPAQVRVAAERLADRHRGRRKASTGSPTKDVEQGPPDPPQHERDTAVGHPLDPPRPSVADGCGGSSGCARDGCGGSSGCVVGDPPDPPTNQDQPPNLTNHPGEDVRTDVAVARANPPDQDPIRLGGDPAETEPTGPGEPAGPAPPRAGPVPAEPAGPAGPITTAQAAALKGCGEPVPRCPHGMHDVVRVSDGRHCCPACRRSLPADPPSAAAQAAARPPGGRTLQPSPAVAHRAAQAATPGRSNVLPFRRPPRSRRKEPA
jgi:hypothetical protein